VDAFFESFRWLYDTTGVNLTILYDAFDRKRFVEGFATTVRLATSCIVLSVAIGVAGAWLQRSNLRLTRRVVYWYIQFFRNTPPLVQLYFFYFGVGAYLKNAAGVPMVSATSVEQEMVPLTAQDRAFRHSARSALALSAWKASDTTALRRWTDMILADPETPASIRGQVQMLLVLAESDQKS